MAENTKSTTGGKKKQSLIDPVYQKFTKSVLRAIGSTEFYAYFMDAIAHAENEIQFSNRRMEKWVDRTWVSNIEEGLGALQKIIATPRNVIHEEELIVNVANAKKAVRKLKDDFADFQGGFSLINMIDIDDRIKAVESTLR